MKKFLKKNGFFLLVLTATILGGIMELSALDVAAIVAAGPYVLVNVTKQSGSPTNKKDKVVLYKLDDLVQSSLARDDKGVYIPQNIQCLPGKYGIEVYGTIDKTAPGYSAEGETDTRGLKHTLAFEHPGDSLEINEYITNGLNDNWIAVTQECGSNMKKVVGTPCHPLQMVPTGQDNAEAKKHMLNFEGVGRTQFTPGKYDGTLPLDSPKATIPDDDTSPSVAQGEGQYQLSENTAATGITTLDDAQDGLSYTLLGTGGANASTIAAGNDFELKDGVTWTASQGAQITFKAFKNGANSFVFVELSRS